ncbi:MAG: hypothetical protein KMY55_09380 [Dethiosulfatibacter sp.]|nr:hypothetical protein [Dethiosulfatibacter sp.]
MEIKSTDLVSIFEKSLRELDAGEKEHELEETGRVVQVGDASCRISGLAKAVYGELLQFEGGNPVIEDGQGGYSGVAAVIDKDLAAERLAEAINADILLILTEVEKVAINFNKPDQKNLSEISCDEAKKYMAEGHFAPGSMLPKVKAAVMFAESKPGRKSIITSLYSANEALKGESGTLIKN